LTTVRIQVGERADVAPDRDKEIDYLCRSQVIRKRIQARNLMVPCGFLMEVPSSERLTVSGENSGLSGRYATR